jgi:hypothetical protein
MENFKLLICFAVNIHCEAFEFQMIIFSKLLILNSHFENLQNKSPY